MMLTPTVNHPRYVTLGDSMSISDYPCLDAESRYARRFTNLGAAALFLRNSDELFPEFRGRDLSSHYEHIDFIELASDGAILLTAESQVERIGGSADIITLTVGGNDLLGAYDAARTERELVDATERISSGYEELVSKIRAMAPGATLILNTVYDPTDGTGRLPDTNEVLPLQFLHSFNDRVRATASRIQAAVLADVHQHFLGHGASAPIDSRWYWSESIIEPGLTGASEIRRLWIEAFEKSPTT